jgi:hypothetical protein
MIDDAIITDRQRRILRHALGIAQTGREYRNHFDPGPKDLADCAALEALGMMSSFTRSWLPGRVFQCTEDGRKIALSGGGEQ